MKEIIVADPMKEVLHLRATFGPRRETMKEIIEADSMKEVLHLRATLAPTPTQQINKLYCQIWAKEGDHEGFFIVLFFIM